MCVAETANKKKGSIIKEHEVKSVKILCKLYLTYFPLSIMAHFNTSWKDIPSAFKSPAGFAAIRFYENTTAQCLN